MQKEDFKKLSIGQLAALCSNMARGCEKQYLNEEAALFRELTFFLTKNTPEVNDADVVNLANILKQDIENYPNVRKVADEEKDRGAARVTVWGEKVTRMLSSLMDRYLNEGESFLYRTDIYVCTVCGFVWVGNEAPELCPVCKVPSWKFEKVEGGIM